jgi:GT2 family glycosyltransferase
LSCQVAVVICNWNKREYLEKCLDAVFQSSYTNIQVYVVDNASSDDSVRFLEQLNHPKVEVILNEVNLGGSGGFNTGVRAALNGNCDYIHLLDNDVVLDHFALEELVTYMNLHAETAAAGSKLYSMDEPARLQEMGADIDWEQFHVRPHFKGCMDSAEIPEIVECDYVPACSVLIRTEVIRKIGLMDEDNFIYWDDIEWFYRMKQAGYQVISYGKSKAWHKMGAANRSNTFPTYYFWRNRVHFFARYTSGEQFTRFIDSLSTQLFDAIFFSNYKKQRNTSLTLMSAVDDAMHSIRGKAADDRILPREIQEDRLLEFISGHPKITLRLMTADNNIVRSVVDRLKNLLPAAQLFLIEGEGLSHDYGIPLVDHDSTNSLVCAVCDHIVDVRRQITVGVLYIDQYWNVAYTSEDARILEEYDTLLKFFKQLYVPLLEQRLRPVRG